MRQRLVILPPGVEFVVKNMTEELKSTGLWANTVFVLTGDNGGTAEHGMPVPGSSNYPLRGHKYSWFEGGVRTATFVYSPLLPAAVRGTTNHALLHVSDWWATFSALAGPLAPSPSPVFVPGLSHAMLIELRRAQLFVPGLPHVAAHSRRPERG